ncbi:MAG: barstar family protein [Oscillospiraceae bacterium]|nr:barstar family protein [Oscillospiraceae bacterium]
MEERELRRFSLDFSECRYLGEIYAQIKSVLELPQWCGENLDALWDAVTGMMYTPAEVTIMPQTRTKELQEDVKEIITVFQEARDEYNEISVIVLEDTE